MAYFSEHLFLLGLGPCVFWFWDPGWWSSLRVSNAGLMTESKNRARLSPLRSFRRLLFRCGKCHMGCQSPKSVSPIGSYTPTGGHGASYMDMDKEVETDYREWVRSEKQLVPSCKRWLNTFDDIELYVSEKTEKKNKVAQNKTAVYFSLTYTSPSSWSTVTIVVHTAKDWSFLYLVSQLCVTRGLRWLQAVV